ncbi:hypothetical protein K504DRAFT_468299 [Pleomassaria siparia CBS 279.74]|uniref:ADP-ribose 1''-phosphate phosphatase n=1 Tax=Pleomassaria siparia CBS 279.74 TaxID=1314801 RepID=A0A6G1K8Z6_9PLEO|nr:hypothetical protein K504DRAFT_468299 [Pleomassaria siparia CBS 279.74]
MPKSQPLSQSKERISNQNSVPAAAGMASLSSSPEGSALLKNSPPDAIQEESTTNPTVESTMSLSKAVSSNTPEAEDRPSISTAEPKDSNTAMPSIPKATRTLTLTTHFGDIFWAPPNTVLIHACNTQGSWGAGIAARFRSIYPEAYATYWRYCVKDHDPKTNPVPTGSCLLIPPCETGAKSRRHWIACLFTSAKYGKAKDKPNAILRNTGPAVKEMLQQVRDAKRDGKEIAGLWMCKINSARFAVPWARTVKVLEDIEVEEGCIGDIQVWGYE